VLVQSPNVVQGVRASDNLPIIAKLASDSEVEIVRVLSRTAGQNVVKPLEIVNIGDRHFLVMQRYQTAIDINIPNSRLWWTFALALLSVCVV